MNNVIVVSACRVLCCVVLRAGSGATSNKFLSAKRATLETCSSGAQ